MKRFKVALGSMAIRTQTELMILRHILQEEQKKLLLRQDSLIYQRIPFRYGNSWFNIRENDYAYYMFRSYNICFYSSSKPVSDEEDEL